MANLIAMTRPQSLPGRAFAAGHSAEILFFTGVRYYRMDEVAKPAKLSAAKIGAAKRQRSPEQRIVSKRLREERRREALA